METKYATTAQIVTGGQGKCDGCGHEHDGLRRIIVGGYFKRGNYLCADCFSALYRLIALELR